MSRASRILIALPIAAGIAFAPALAHADFYRGGYGHRGYYGGHRGYYGGHRGHGGAGIALGAILGLGVGAAILGATQPRYYAPPPVYYAPPPRAYYAPPPVAYAPPRYYAPGYAYAPAYPQAGYYPPPYVLNR